MNTIHPISFDQTLITQLQERSPVSFFTSNRALSQKLQALSTSELESFIQSLVQESISHSKDPLKYLDYLSTTIPIEKLKEVLHGEFSNPEETAKALLEEAKFYFQIAAKNSAPHFQQQWANFLESAINLLDSLIGVFGIGDLFQASESDIEAQDKYHKTMSMFYFFEMISKILLPILGELAGGPILGGVILCFFALSIAWPSIRPMTHFLPGNAENWTRETQEQVFLAQGRKDSIDTIASIMKKNKHAMLIGPSRVGKSLTAKAFAHAVAQGDYPELSGKVVFRINTADLIDQKASYRGGGNDILKKISKTMGRHKNDIILVLDEIHVACTKNEKISEQLKIFLDEHGKFPHVIGITNEYDKYVKPNEAFALRFENVLIENTSKDETIRILGEKVLRSSLKPFIEKDVLSYIFEKSSLETSPQPVSALNLLQECLAKCEMTQKSKTETKLTALSNKILSLRTQSLLNQDILKEKKIEPLEQEKKELQEKFQEEQKEKGILFKMKAIFEQATQELYKDSLAISQGTSHSNKQISKFLLHVSLRKQLHSLIVEKSRKLGIKTVINKALVDEILRKRS